MNELKNENFSYFSGTGRHDIHLRLYIKRIQYRHIILFLKGGIQRLNEFYYFVITGNDAICVYMDINQYMT